MSAFAVPVCERVIPGTPKTSYIFVLVQLERIGSSTPAIPLQELLAREPNAGMEEIREIAPIEQHMMRNTCKFIMAGPQLISYSVYAVL
jgi:hypothetical protein